MFKGHEIALCTSSYRGGVQCIMRSRNEIVISASESCKWHLFDHFVGDW
jgi:hypothetical protein